MMDYYIYGYFRDINPSGPSVRKVTGRKFDCGGMWWYYRAVTDNKGKKWYEVTIPSLGMTIGSYARLKDAREFILNNLDNIIDKCCTDELIRVERRFQELVAEAKENENKS